MLARATLVRASPPIVNTHTYTGKKSASKPQFTEQHGAWKVIAWHYWSLWKANRKGCWY